MSGLAAAPRTQNDALPRPARAYSGSPPDASLRRLRVSAQGAELAIRRGTAAGADSVPVVAVEPYVTAAGAEKSPTRGPSPESGPGPANGGPRVGARKSETPSPLRTDAGDPYAAARAAQPRHDNLAAHTLAGREPILLAESEMQPEVNPRDARLVCGLRKPAIAARHGACSLASELEVDAVGAVEPRQHGGRGTGQR